MKMYTTTRKYVTSGAIPVLTSNEAALIRRMIIDQEAKKARKFATKDMSADFPQLLAMR